MKSEKGVEERQKFKNITLNPTNDATYSNRLNNITFQAMKKSQFQGVDRFIVERYKAPIEKFNVLDYYSIKKHDPKNFESNVEKLKMLSHDNWCTKSFNAEPYLSEGDFHIYMEAGKPKLGVRFVEDIVCEIQGAKNDGKIPFKYYDVITGYLKNYKLNYSAEDELEALETAKKSIEKIRARFPQGIENATTHQILKFLRIPYSRIKGTELLAIEFYKNPFAKNIFAKNISLTDIGIDENKLFKDIKAIKGDADFENTGVTDLGNLVYIGGSANFENSELESLGNVWFIGENANFTGSQITDLGKLKEIGLDAYFGDSYLESLGRLEKIGENAYFEDSNIGDLGRLKSIGGSAFFSRSNLTDLGNLEIIGRRADFMESKIVKALKLRYIGGLIDMGSAQYGSQLEERINSLPAS